MKIKYYVTEQLFEEMRKERKLRELSYCDNYSQRFEDDDMCNRYFGTSEENEGECSSFVEVGEYDDQENTFTVPMVGSYDFE